MTLEKKEKSALNNFKLGNYKQAAGEYSNLLNNTDIQEDKYFYENKINLCNENHNLVTYLSEGEAFFPVYNEADKITAILSLKITNSPSGKKQYDISVVKEAVKIFLDDYLFREIKTVMVFDWMIDNLVAEIKFIPNSNEDFNRFVEGIGGRSFELAATVAIISKILDVKVSEKFIFSGSVEIDDGKIRIKRANRVEDKLKCVVLERPSTSKFFIPNNANIETDSLLSGINFLKELIPEIFPNFKEILHNKMFSDSTENKITLKLNDSNIKDGPDIIVFNFEHEKIEDCYISKIPRYLKNISSLIKGEKKGIVLDGLRASFLPTMLVSSQDVANQISNFIAVRYLAPDDKVYSKAAVVRTVNSGNPTLNVGDHFLYKIP